MNQKNVVENIDINISPNNDDIQIEYNDDFELEKTKSLNKFPLKILTNNEFYLDDIYKNFSKSLNFNFHKCYAPKQKIKHSNQNPTPIFLEKQLDINNLPIQGHIINDDILSEKGLSLDYESSFSSDFENQNNKNYSKNNINNDLIDNNQIIINNNNYIISKNLLDNSSDKNESLYENKINRINDNENNLKLYEHKTITSFPVKINFNETYTKGNIKAIRNSLFRAKLKSLKDQNKEVEYYIKDRLKTKYGLDIKHKYKKFDHNFECYKVIPIRNDKNGNDIDDMSNFRKTISYNASKLNLENNKKNDEKSITIYDVLITNKKNKDEK